MVSRRIWLKCFRCHQTAVLSLLQLGLNFLLNSWCGYIWLHPDVDEEDCDEDAAPADEEDDEGEEDEEEENEEEEDDDLSGEVGWE